MPVSSLRAHRKWEEKNCDSNSYHPISNGFILLSIDLHYTMLSVTFGAITFSNSINRSNILAKP